MHACAAEYVLGPANTNACPAGYSKIPTAEMCRAAAKAVEKPYGGAVAQARRPSGCFLDIGNPYKVDFSPSEPGAAFVNAQPLCRFGAPCVRVCVCSFRVITLCSHGDVFSTEAVTARHSRIAIAGGGSARVCSHVRDERCQHQRLPGGVLQDHRQHDVSSRGGVPCEVVR